MDYIKFKYRRLSKDNVVGKRLIGRTRWLDIFLDKDSIIQVSVREDGIMTIRSLTGRLRIEPVASNAVEIHTTKSFSGERRK